MLGLQGNFENQIGGAYFAVILAYMGIYPSAPALIAWVGNDLAPASRRAIGVAFNIALGTRVATGFGLSLTFGVTGLLTAVAAEPAYKWMNARRAKVSEEELRGRYTQDQLVAMGPQSPLFKYTL